MALSEIPLESVRAYWDERPCNIRHSQIDLDVNPEGYDREVARRRYFVEPHIADFAEFDRWRGKRVLDLGCGIGTDAISFAAAGAVVTAVDISPRSIEIARKRARPYELGIQFVCGDIEELPRCVVPEHYDLVYSFGVLHHTPHPERVVQHIRNHYVGSDSVLKVMLYHRYSWKACWILLTFGRGRFWELEELVARHSEAQTGCPVTCTYTRKSAEDLLEGFAIEDLSIDHIFPYRIQDYVDYHFVREWYWRLLPRRIFRWLERRIGWHMLITARAA